MWDDMDPIWSATTSTVFYMEAVVGIISRHGLTIEVCHKKQSNKPKLMLYKPLFPL